MRINDMFLGDFKTMIKEWIGTDEFALMEQELQLNNIILNVEGVKEYKTKVWDYLIKINVVAF